MKLLLNTLLVLVFSTQLFAQEYSRVKLDLRNHDIHDVARLGVEVEHGHLEKQKFFINDFSAKELLLFEEAGIPFEVVIADVQKWYIDQEAAKFIEDFRPDCDQEDGVNVLDKYETPEDYEYGSMGGYLTYEEFLAQLDLMYEKYPNLITPKTPIGDIKTHEGRDVYFLRVSNNPTVDEEKPEILYTALHHAREPNSLSQLIFYLWYILENYEDDPQLKFLVDNTEMYFIPMINPDGYVFNQMAAPNGGGFWRKNRRDNGDGTFGVDLNRNYDYQWGLDDEGSSPFTDSQTYRGPAPHSEPEVQAVTQLVNEHEFQLALNYHTFSNVLIHPWGYQNQTSEDDHIFKGMAEIITQENTYPYGTAFETIGYNANGNSDDWFYAGDSKPKIFAMTPEVGPGLFGFWPPEVAIDELNKFCVLQNIAAANLLHYYLDVQYDNAKVINATGSFELDLQRWGLADGTAQLSVSTETAGLTVDPSVYDVAVLFTEQASYEFPYSYEFSPGEGKVDVTFNIQLDYGEYTISEDVVRTIENGEYVPIFSMDSDNLDGWTTNDEWNVTEEDFVSAPVSITDSPGEEYKNQSSTELLLDESISLIGLTDARITYSAKWDIEDEYDYVQILISADGAGFEPACGLYTNNGSQFQDMGQPLYDGTQNSWVAESIDLADYLGQTIQVKFILESDGFITGDGFYFDDFQVISLLPTAVEDELLAKQLVISPVPAQDFLNIDFTGSENITSLQLINAVGQQVYTSNNIEKNTQIDISTLEQGSYACLAELSNGLTIRKMWIKLK